MHSLWLHYASHRYQPIAIHSPQNLKENDDDDHRHSLRATNRLRILPWLALNVGALALIGIFALGPSLRRDCPPNSNADMLRHISAYSPLFDRMNIDLVDKRMNNTLLQSPYDEIYRNAPSPEVDQAWLRIGHEAPIAITRDEVLKLGKDPATRVRYPTSFGMGEAYAARIDIFHQIHCLDALRREAYWDHYYGNMYESYESTPKLHKAHLSHCIYYLLQNIMCSASLDVYTHVWTDAVNNPFPDFNMTKKCKNFDAILDYQERNAVPPEEFYEMRRPAEYGPALQYSEAFKDLWREFDLYNEEGVSQHGHHIG